MGDPSHISHIVLGIDPGTATTGFGLVEKRGNTLVHLAHGTIRTSPKLSDSQRLIEIASQLKKLIQTNQPHQIAVEKLFFSKNVKTAMSVSQARGVILMTAASAAIEILEYSPNEIKLAVTGYGKADKTQVQKMVKTLLNMADTPKPDDAADALATAICHLHQSRFAWQNIKHDRNSQR